MKTIQKTTTFSKRNNKPDLLKISAPYELAFSDFWRIRDETEMTVAGFLVADHLLHRQHVAAGGKLDLFRNQACGLVYLVAEYYRDRSHADYLAGLRIAFREAGIPDELPPLVDRCIPSAVGVAHYTRRLVELDRISRTIWRSYMTSRDLLAAAVAEYATPWAIR